MTKLWILSILVAVFACAKAITTPESLNTDLREQLGFYGDFQKEADNANYLDDLKKLISLTEDALKIESYDEKKKFMDSISKNFSTEFNDWISSKTEKAQLQAEIHEAIDFYSSLLTPQVEYEAEIKKTLSTLENLLKESDFKQTKEKFLDLPKSFSPKFEKFIRENILPTVNISLKISAEFYKNLLQDKTIKYAEKIRDLKEKAEGALDTMVSLDDKQKVYDEVTKFKNQELKEYLDDKQTVYLYWSWKKTYF